MTTRNEEVRRRHELQKQASAKICEGIDMLIWDGTMTFEEAIDFVKEEIDSLVPGMAVQKQIECEEMAMELEIERDWRQLVKDGDILGAMEMLTSLGNSKEEAKDRIERHALFLKKL